MNASRVNFTKEDIGAEILPILTTGLYRNTLDALREYIQNAVDAEAQEIRLIVDPDVSRSPTTGLAWTATKQKRHPLWSFRQESVRKCRVQGYRHLQRIQYMRFTRGLH